MLVDLEGNRIDLVFKNNEHIKILGKSGYGKTYWAYRYIEENCIRKAIWIIDYSGSYTPYELNKGQFSYGEKIDETNPKEELFYIFGGDSEADVVENTVDTLIAIIEIDAMMQREILEKVCEMVMKNNGFISIKRVFAQLNEMRVTCGESSTVNNIDFLKNRLYHLRKLDSIRITLGRQKYYPGIHIIQLSDYTDRIRLDISQIILELLWKERKNNKKEQEVIIVLDEFQNLKIKGTSVEMMLRQGRKKGIGLVMLSQFSTEKKDNDIIDQSDTSLYFHINEKNQLSTAKTIDLNNWREWVQIFQRLKKGTCVLKGEYTVNGKNIVHSKPIVCKVVKAELKE